MSEYKIIYLENGVAVRKIVEATKFEINGEYGNMIAMFYKGVMLVSAYSNVVLVEQRDKEGVE